VGHFSGVSDEDFNKRLIYEDKKVQEYKIIYPKWSIEFEDESKILSHMKQ